MSRWTLLFALALACWLPMQSAFSWLPVQQPVRVDASTSDSSRSSSVAVSPAAGMANCHGMMAMMDPPCIQMPLWRRVDAASADGCPMQVTWLSMDHGDKHCSACVQVPADLPRLGLVIDVGPRQPDLASSSRLSIIATLFLVFLFRPPVIPWPDGSADIGQILVLIFSACLLRVFGGV